MSADIQPVPGRTAEPLPKPRQNPLLLTWHEHLQEVKCGIRLCFRSSSTFFVHFFVVTITAGEDAVGARHGEEELLACEVPQATEPAGPRVVQRMGQDHSLFRVFQKETAQGSPRNAILAQALITVLFVLFTSFKDIIEYIGITLTLFSLLTVCGVFLLRFRKQLGPDSVRTWGYPLTPALFLLAGLWMLLYFGLNDPWKLAASVLTLLPAVLTYGFRPSKG